MEKPGLKLVETLAPQILHHWKAMKAEHPECGDFVAVLENRPSGVALTFGGREDFVAFARDSGLWVEDSTWSVLLEPAGILAIWVVVHLGSESAILRLHDPIVSKGGSA